MFDTYLLQILQEFDAKWCLSFYNFAERKLQGMEGVAAKIQEEISGLQSERAALLAKLEKIELSLTKAQAAKVMNLIKYPNICLGLNPYLATSEILAREKVQIINIHSPAILASTSVAR